MNLLRFGLVAGFLLPATLFCPDVALAQPPAEGPAAQEETAEEKRERVTAERFLQLLKRRPRLGTALDKVYGFHVGRGSLDAFCTSLEKEAKAGNDGASWMILGMVQMQRGQDTQAVASLEKATELMPKAPLPSYYLGKTLLLLGEVDRAADAMRTAIERKPARADMLAIFQDLGRIFQRTGRSDDALGVWEQLESLFPNDSQVQEEIARILAEEGALEPAVERYDKLGAKTKDRFRQVEMAIRSAQLKAQLGQTKEALAAFEKQLARVNPDSWLHRDIRRRIEEVFWSTGDIDGLVKYYTTWVEKHPEDVDAMMRAARFLAVQRRLPEAEEWFRKAIEKAPSKTEPRLALVEALVGDDKYAKAAIEMQQLVELEPDNPDYVVQWGEMVFNDADRTEAQRKSEAAEIWKGMLEKRGEDPVTVARVADLLRAVESVDQAIAQYEKAIKLAPAEPQYREYLGEYLHQLGHKEEAVKQWRELASGDRATLENLVRLSEVFSTFGYADQALETMAQACELKPTFGHRARYAELLRGAARYDDALTQLDLAEPMAEDPELRELVVAERIKNYQASGTLDKRIEQAEAAVDGDKGSDANAWQVLALLKEADRKFHAACEAAHKATELAPGNVGVWETAATLQERSGRYGDAIASYRKLATLDRRFLSNYLTQIASLHMRLGDTDAALKTGEELIASAPGNADHYRFFADLCFRIGEEETGFDVLRRSVRSNPNDEDALLYLARQLSEGFHTDEAIELYWRGFDLATDLDGRNAVIAPLTELYLRTNRFDPFIDRLESTSREQNKKREGMLWVAAAHQAAGDLGTARQMLEQLAREDSRDTKLLKQLVTLCRAEYDHEAAAEYQKRLVSVAPSVEDEYLLANILMELGELDQSEALWLKLTQRKADPTAMVNAISTLVQRQQLEMAQTLINKTLSAQPDNWEVLAQAVIVSAQLDKPDEAHKAADRLLAMTVPPGQPSAKVKQAIERRANRRQDRVNTYDPYQNLGKPAGLVEAATQIKQALAPGSNNSYYGSRNQRSYAPRCFQEAQAVAYGLPFVLKVEGFDAKAFVKEFSAEAVESDAAEKLWRAIFYHVWQTPGVQYGQQTNEDFEKCLERLVEKEEPAAASMRMQGLVNSRQRLVNGDATKLKPMKEEELQQARQWCEIASKGSRTSNPNYYHLWIAAEFARADMQEEADKLIEGYVTAAKNSPNGWSSLLQAMSMLLSERFGGPPSPESIEKGLSLFEASLASTKFNPRSNNQGYGSTYHGLVTQLVKHDRLDAALECVDGMLHWQAEQTAKLRPSQRDRPTNSTGPMNFGRSVNGQYEQVVIQFPTPSSSFGAQAIFMVHGLYDSCKEDKQKLAEIERQMQQWTEEEVDDPYLRYARVMAKASLEYWQGDHQAVGETLTAASKMQVGGQFVDLALARLLYEQNKVSEALEVVERLRPSNQRMLVDRELALLELVLQLGDIERAKKSARKLFALRLASGTELTLADLMYKLGMPELGDRMMGRIRRRSGGKQDTLVQLMERYAAANKNEEAAEVALQVIRRTSPRTSLRYTTSENQQHEKAVRVLAQTKQLDGVIKQYEKLVENSPRSTKLIDKLAAFYEGAGRRADAQKLRIKAAEVAPDDPRNLLAAGQRLASLNKHDEAAQKFIAAIVKQPDVMNNSYYEMRDSFKAAKAWGKLADAIVDEGIGKFSQSYRMSEIMSQLSRSKETKAINRLLKAGLTEMTLPEMARMMYSLSRAEFEVDKEVVKLLEEKLTADDSELQGFSSNAYIYSRSSNGQSTGFINGIAMIIAQDDPLKKKVAEAMNAKLEEDDTQLFPRVMLAMVLIMAEDFDQARDALKPLMEKDEKDQNDGQAIWCLASQLAHSSGQPALACELMESVENPELFDRNSSSDFQFTSRALLAFAYEKADRKPAARRILVERMTNMKIDERQNQYNPGYGEYQYIESQQSLSQRFIDMGYPAEAFIAYRKAYGDPEMLERARRWGGDPTWRKKRLTKAISEKTDAKAVIAIVDAVIHPQPAKPAADTDDNPDADAEQQTLQESLDFALYLTEPEISRRSMIDVRVTMPLEEFTLKLTDDKKLKEEVSKWLEETADRESAEPPTLKALVTRLMVSDAVDNTQQQLLASQAVLDWVKEQQDEEIDKGSSDSETDEPGKLPDELLLGMAAMKMPEEKADNETIVMMLQRALDAAKRSGQKELASGLQCQIASRIAVSDPDRARTIFYETLDRVLPVQEQASKPKTKS